MAPRFSDRQLAGLLAAGAVGVFVADLLSPLGFSVGMFYAPLVAGAALLCTSRTAIGLTAFFLLLMGAEVFLSSAPTSLDVRRLAIVNRGLAMVMVAIMAGLMIPLRRIRVALTASRERYQELVESTAAALAESEQRFRSFMENTPAVAFMKDARGRYVYANRLWRQTFARDERPIEELDDSQLFPADAAAEFRRRDAEVIQTGQPWQGQERVTFAGETRHWWVFKFPVTNAAAERFLGGVAFDITDRITAAEEIRRLNAELEERVQRRTEQVEAVNKELEAFTYSVSHDLRAPLRGMSGFARVLEEDYGERLDEDGRRYLEIIKSNAAQMGQLIDDLLALSRLGRQPLRATTLSLEPLIREAFRQATADEPKAAIEFSIDPLPDCRGDANLMRQVFINLLSNAVKFSRHASPPRIRVGSKSENGEVVFFVRDNGAGFDIRYANKLFGVFQRLHGPEEFAGTGVGLAIVKRIVERHGGRVWAEGETGKGATFYFTLGNENCRDG
ncbi:MAG: ATP-binding protein [Pirellulales bacterium]